MEEQGQHFLFNFHKNCVIHILFPSNINMHTMKEKRQIYPTLFLHLRIAITDYTCITFTISPNHKKFNVGQKVCHCYIMYARMTMSCKSFGANFKRQVKNFNNRAFTLSKDEVHFVTMSIR